jgi:hypothetical protein
VDNPNVLFEAGMLHALTFLSIQGTSGWIPIREQNSPQPPFDFAGERIELIPRAADGSLNQEMFRTRLRARLKGLVSD